MPQKKPYIIGVDVGGTKILLESFDQKMNLISEERMPTEVKKGEKGFSDQLQALIRKHFKRGLKAIGIAVPGIVNRDRGTLVKAPHLPTKKDFPLKKMMEKAFGVPVHVDNDINAFLIAEKERPALKKYQNIVAVMVGTGLGGAILAEGQLVTGASGYAGEVGHMVIRQDGPLKTLEQNTSGAYHSKISKDPLKLNRHLAEQLGIGLSNLNLIFNPDIFLLGGSVYRFHLANEKKKLEGIIASKSLDGKSPKIVNASSRTSVAYGAALLALRK